MRAEIGACIATIIIVISGAALAAEKAAIKSTARPFDFKGVPLEISLDDFRKLPHPDGGSEHVVCTGDPDARSSSIDSYDATEIKLGVVKCAWANKEKWMVGDAGLSLANTKYAANFYSFSFIADPKDGVKKLFRFEGTSNAAAAQDVIAAITTKFGKPKIVKGSVQNRIGNRFEKTSAIWVNSKSSLSVEDRFTKVDDMEIVMIDNRLSDIVIAAKNASGSKNPI
jgi:hypothetical protein